VVESSYSGDEIRVLLQANLIDTDYVWRWNTRIMSHKGSTGIKADFKQSTFYATLLSPAQLSRKTADYVATLSEDGEIDRFILDRMDGNQPLGDIAGALMSNFSHHFRDWNDALGRVGILSQRYCH
jgi:type I protein arginine methyltransferase